MRRVLLLFPLLLLGAFPPAPIPPVDRVLAEGVTHRQIVTERGEVVNILFLALRSGAHLTAVQGEERYEGIEDLRSIYQRVYRDRLDAQVLAAVNAGSWRPDRMTPVGPRIATGELVEIQGFHEWPSLVISSAGRAAISNVIISARITWKYRTIVVADVNRRATGEGLVLYNRFGGGSVPSINRPGESELQSAVRAQISIAGGDQGAGEIDTAALLRDLRMTTRDRGLENGTMKVVCIPIAARAGNARGNVPRALSLPGDTMLMVVQKMTTDTVMIPPNGYVLSLGSARDLFSYATVGDTIRLLLSATAAAGESAAPLPIDRITEIVTGTPRLVAAGMVETFDERDGIHPETFYTGELARTAVGTTAGGDTVMLVTIDPPDAATGRHGVTLSRLAELMRSFGAYNALNLENGNASGMIIEGIPVGGTLDGREKVSSALVVLRTKK